MPSKSSSSRRASASTESGAPAAAERARDAVSTESPEPAGAAGVKTPAKKTAAKKSAAKKTTAKAPAKKAAAKTAAAKKTGATKAAAKKSATAKPAVKKTIAKKTAEKKAATPAAAPAEAPTAVAAEAAIAEPAPAATSPATRGKPRTGATALVEQLEAIGVRVVFGIPGVHNLPIFDALSRSSIRTIVVRHEQAAAYAADGYARATGALGVCVTTTGPGAANAAAAMGEARMARSPVLHISTQLDTKALEGRTGRFALHDAPDQVDMMRTVTRWAGRVQREDAMTQMVHRGAREAYNGRRGPAFLEIPFDLLDEEVEDSPPIQRSLYSPMMPNPNPIVRAADRLQRAKSPMVWAGGGVISAGAGEALVAVAEMLDAPVVTSFNGKGAISPKHPLCVGLPPHEPAVSKLIQKSDAALIVGSDLDGPNTQGWRLPFPRPRVGINCVGEDARRNYACDVLIEADALLALEALYDELTPDDRKGIKRTKDVREETLGKLREDPGSREPFAFVEQLRATLPDDAFVLADMAIAGYWCAGYLPSPQPRTFAYPLGWGTLGFALPAAIGVAAAGRRPVVVCGDGGFLFSPGELATFVQEDLRAIIVVVDDGGYGMLRYDQRERFDATFGVDLRTPDFVALAAAFGMASKSATPGEFPDALGWALAQRGPSLLHVRASWQPPVTTSPRWPLRDRPEARP